jgi:O-methyltransferase
MTINDQFNEVETGVLLRELNKILDARVVGDIVELGCYKGRTSVLIQKKLVGTNKKLYLYDSFAGLPPKNNQDLSPLGEQFKTGQLLASKHEVIKAFKQAGLAMPVIREAWFSELKSEDLPERIALAFLDGDFYESILTSLKLVWPKLSDGAVVIIDDYHNAALPGVQKAVIRWQQEHRFGLKNEASLAIIQKG